MTLRITLIIFVLCLICGCMHTGPGQLHCERLRAKDHDTETLEVNISLPAKPLTLEDIIEIAICNNLDLKVKEREIAIQHERATGQKLKMLPSYTFTTEQSWRNETTASTSIDATTGQPVSNIDPVTGAVLPPSPSISSSQRVNRWDLTAAYNLVDFGISYLRARQEVNRTISSFFQYERQKQNVILDVYKAYWKTIAARQTIARAKDLIQTSLGLQERIEKKVKSLLIPSLTGLRSELQLVNIRNRLNPIEKIYQDGKAELAALMGFPAHHEYELADVTIDMEPYKLDEMEIMEDIALSNRPELYASDAENKIFKDEVKAALVNMFPNISIFAGRNYDGDPFLVHHYWTLTGMRAAWNLLALPQHWYERREAKERVKLSYDSRLALTLGVITQVHLAYFTYLDTYRNFKNINETASLNSRMLYIASRQREFGALDGIDMINFEADSLEAEFNLLSAYGQVKTAIELLDNAMGVPLYYQQFSVEQMCCSRESCE